MRFADISSEDPAVTLAWDEAFLRGVEAGGDDVLWFWEAQEPFVVIGYGQSMTREVNVEACAQRGVTVYRRCTGGGTVVQGPGCLNYGLALRWENEPHLASVTQANQWIMARQATALSRLGIGTISVQGHTDLAVWIAEGEWRKFSGNAQRRTRNALLFHGTVLCRFNLALIAELLPSPSEQPAYRAGRAHADFLTNLSLPIAAVRAAIQDEWEVTETLEKLPWDYHRQAYDDRYRHPEWHQHRRLPARDDSASIYLSGKG